MRTYEELLAAQTELAHFNPNHDPRTGRFAKSSNSEHLESTEPPNRKEKIIKRLKSARDTIELVKDITHVAGGIALTAIMMKAMSPVLKDVLASSVNSINHSHQQFAQFKEKADRILGSGLGDMTMDELSKLNLY